VVAGIVRTIRQLIEEGTPIDYSTVLQSLTDETDRELLTGIAFRDDPVEGSVEDCLWACKRDRLKRMQWEAVRQLGELENGPTDDRTETSTEDVNEMLSRVQEIARQRDALH
jgi:hypothetical protein